MIKSIMYVYAIISIIISYAFAYEIRMKTLYLTASINSLSPYKTFGTNFNSQVPVMLDAYGMNYDTVVLPTESLTLEDGNVALYNSIVIEGAIVDMLKQINSQIEEYQRKYKIRVVYLNCEPDTSTGVLNYNQNVNARNVTLTEQGLELAKKYQMNGKDVSFVVGNCIPDINLLCIQYHHYDVQYDVNANITPILKYNEVDAYAGAFIKNNDLESIHFWFPFIDSHIAYFASHLWILWSNYGIINGYRRLYFDIQIDDFFTDNCFNSSNCSMDPTAHHYRTSVEDMENIAEWQSDVSSRLPKGSDIRIELAINGFHILNKAQHKHLIVQDWTDYPQYNNGYKKPLEENGSTRWGDNIDSEWDDNILQQNDELYKYFKDPKNQDNFYWVSHTFSHQKLDYASYHDADTEMKLNIKMSSEPYLGMYNRPCFSPNSIVTPEISGLHNGDALRALSENNVFYAVGDTSRPDLSPANFYYPFISNQTSSNFDGFYVIPRQPTEVYWDCSTIDENMAIYNERYNTFNVDWNTNLNIEAVRHVKDFLKLRHDPYMFHEGNLRNADFPEVTIGEATGKFGMMQQWVERMVVEINKYVDWPVRSIKMDDLAKTYLDRLDKMECQPQYTMIIDDNTDIIQEIKVEKTGTKDCRVPLFMERNKVSFIDLDINTEKYGEEHETAWIDLKEGPVSVRFTKEIKFSDEEFVGKQLYKSGSFSISSLFTGYKLYIWIIGFALIVSVVIYFVFGRRKGYTNNDPYDYSSRSSSTTNPSPAPSPAFEHDQPYGEYEHQQQQLQQDEQQLQPKQPAQQQAQQQQQQQKPYMTNISNINMNDYNNYAVLN